MKNLNLTKEELDLIKNLREREEQKKREQEQREAAQKEEKVQRAILSREKSLRREEEKSRKVKKFFELLQKNSVDCKLIERTKEIWQNDILKREPLKYQYRTIELKVNETYKSLNLSFDGEKILLPYQIQGSFRFLLPKTAVSKIQKYLEEKKIDLSYEKN